MLNHEQIEWVVSPETLSSMSHLTLKQRASAIKHQFGLPSFGHETLRQLYLRHGVAFKKPDYTYWKSLAEKD